MSLHKFGKSKRARHNWALSSLWEKYTPTWETKLTLDNVAINDVLPLKAALRYAIANAKWLLGPRDANDLISMVSFTFAIRYSALNSTIYLLPFDTVWLGSVCWPPYATPGNEAEHRIYRGCSKTQVLFEPVCGPKFMKFWNDAADPSYFWTPLPDYLCHVSFRKQSPLSLEVVEKPNKC